MQLTYQNVITLRHALQMLEGREKAVEAKGQIQVIVKPFKFSGKTRLKIARNLRVLNEPFADYDAARVGLVRELAGEGDRVPDDKLAVFNQRNSELLKHTVEISSLEKLHEAELDLDENDIPHGALAALMGHLLG